MRTFLKRLPLLGILLATGVLIGVSSQVSAQGPFSAQIQAALRSFLITAHTWTGTQTFGNVTVGGTCTGCGGGANGAWTLKNAGGTAMAGLTTIDQIGLSACTDVAVTLIAGQTSGSQSIGLRVSTDNGSTFLQASGDYQAIASNGVVTNTTELLFDSAGPSAAARTGDLEIARFNVASPKVSHSNVFSTDGVFLRIIPTTTVLNAVRLFTSATFASGTVYFFCR